ncbi:hypothetical protein VDG1235_3414 [Verrucomicrobiia bacterium DG1235]|nr:hypothetical protein VDG1235_3414 [Verrucomicrobiae bacterium DG1235]
MSGAIDVVKYVLKTKVRTSVPNAELAKSKKAQDMTRLREDSGTRESEPIQAPNASL